MSSGHEVEIKFRVKDLAALAAKLGELKFRMVTERTHEMNTLYDLTGSPLRKRGALLRLRQYGPKWTITYKDKSKVTSTRHKSRREIETQVEHGMALAELLTAVGFKATFTYEKFRSEWSDGQGHVVIDETPVGNFAEVEGPGEWIDLIAAKLNIAEKEYITLSYGELFAQWKKRTRSKATRMLFSR